MKVFRIWNVLAHLIGDTSKNTIRSLEKLTSSFQKPPLDYVGQNLMPGPKPSSPTDYLHSSSHRQPSF